MGEKWVGKGKHKGLPMTIATFQQVTFRIRDDDGDETGATWLADQGNDYTMDTDTKFRVRFRCDETTGTKSWSNNTFNLYYSHEGGTYAPVGAATPVQYTSSGYYTSGIDCTTQLTGGTGSFVTDNNGQVHSTQAVTNSGAAGELFECEFCLTIDYDQVTDEDTIELRVYNGSTAFGSGYTDWPVITVNKVTPPAAPDPVDILHANTIDKVTITQLNSLTVEEVSHANTIDKPAASQPGVWYEDEFNDESTAAFWTWDGDTAGTHTENATGEHEIYAGTGQAWTTWEPAWLYQDEVSGDFDIYTEVTVPTLTANFQHAGLVAWVSSGNFVTVRRYYYNEECIVYAHFVGNTAYQADHITTSATTLWLRLVRSGSTFTAYYALSEPADDEDWTQISQPSTTLSSSADLTLAIQANTQGAAQFTALFDYFREWSAGLSSDPEDIFHDHTIDKATITKVSTPSPKEVSHGNLIDKAGITQDQSLNSVEIAHANTIDKAATTQTHSVTVTEVSHAHTIDVAVTTQVHQPSVVDVGHGHEIDKATITQTNKPVPEELLHSHTIDKATATQEYGVTSIEIEHSHTIDVVTATASQAAIVTEIWHSHTIDKVVYTQVHQLGSIEIEHNNVVDKAVITQTNSSTVTDIGHSNTIDKVTISVGADTTDPTDVGHGHSIQPSTVTQTYMVSVTDVSHGNTIEPASPTQAHQLGIADVLHDNTVDLSVITQTNSLTVTEIFHDNSMDRAVIILAGTVAVGRNMLLVWARRRQHKKSKNIHNRR